MSELRISKDLKLPLQAVTQTFAILAKRGVGKTYTASVMAEEMIKANLQTIIIDPIGVWWGLRTSADGKKPGLPIVIVGGDYADVPIDPTNGEVVANLVVNEKLSVVIDLSLFRKNEQVRFMTDFAETLYHDNRSALHLIVDEADAFAPQRAFKGQERLLGAMEDLVRRGRARGIGVTLITQRPAVLNKNVLTQIEVLVALRLIAPQDRNAVDEWIKIHADEDQRARFMESLPQLDIGEAWFWSPGWLDIFQRIHVRKRETLDSSSTPEAGKEIKQSNAMADVNLDKIRKQLATTIEKMEADDPKVLKRRIIDLEKQLKKKPETKVERVEIPIITDDQMKWLKKNVPELIKILAPVMNEIKAPMLKVPDIRVSDRQPINPKPSQPIILPKDTEFINGQKPLSRAARAILAVLAQFLDGRTKQQLSIQSGYSIKSSSFSNALGELRSRGLISAAGSDPIIITEQGIQEAGDVQELPADLIEYWRGKLGKAERSIFDVLVNQYPQSLEKMQISELSGYSATSSSFSNALGKLRSLQLIEGYGQVQASDSLF